MPSLDRDALILEHLAWCRSVAYTALRRMPLSVERDDVTQDAYIGLVKAARAFDPARGVPFQAFALIRIRGEIADQLREADPLYRSERRAVRCGEKLLPRAAQRPASIDEDISVLGAVHAVEDPSTDAAFTAVLVSDLVRRLPVRERLILGMLNEGYVQREIGDVLDLTASRVCQLRGHAYRQLAAMAA